MLESDVQPRAQLFPEDGHESCVSVVDDRSRQPVVLHDVLDKLVCGVDGRGFLSCLDKVCHLGISVRHREYAVVYAPIPCDPWQRYDPIHPDCLPFMHWRGHALHDSSGYVMVSFRMLIDVTR